jgi:hypothetical protein
VHGVVRGAYIKWSGGVCAALGGQEALCVVNRVVYVMVRKVREEVRSCMRWSERWSREWMVWCGRRMMLSSGQEVD